MYCDRCRQELITNLESFDFVILERLRDLGATNAPLARLQDEVRSGMTVDPPMTEAEFRERRIRLCGVGFVRVEHRGRALGLWLTADGAKALAQFAAESISGRNV